jgi:hypothetical protein
MIIKNLNIGPTLQGKLVCERKDINIECGKNNITDKISLCSTGWLQTYSPPASSS